MEKKDNSTQQSVIKKFTKRVNSVTKTAIEEGVPL